MHSRVWGRAAGTVRRLLKSAGLALLGVLAGVATLGVVTRASLNALPMSFYRLALELTG